MITLYELHWSHYCEKVRLALNYMGLAWRAVGIDAFRKAELEAHPLPAQLPNYTVPAIHDAATGAFVMDSTPILRYLAATYPNAPVLFPGDGALRDAIDASLLEFDCQLALPARRFAYTQVILECASLLPRLFLEHRAKGFFLWPGVRSVAAGFIATMLTKRFEFHRAEAQGLYEALERYLVALAAQLEGRAFVVGDSLSAADLALAAQLRPLTIVPFFAEHPRLAGLFDRQRAILAQWSGEGESAYQAAIRQARTRRPPMRRRLRERWSSLPFAPRGGFAENDQRPVWDLGLLMAPWHCLVGLRDNKVRAEHAGRGVR